MPANTDLATIALIALAREMKEDEWAQQFLNQMGLISVQPLRQRENTAKFVIAGIGAELKEKSMVLPNLHCRKFLTFPLCPAML